MHTRWLLFPLALALGAASPVAGRSERLVVADTERLDFNRPESWAMKYYASLTLPTGVGFPRERRAGEVELAFEGGSVPQLSTEDRRVGFDGTKVEDVNKTRVFGRLRGIVGLGGGFALDLAYTPPIRVGGARPDILALALGRPLALSSFRLGLRGYGQIGKVTADITCSAGEVAAGSDPSRNPFECVRPSQDESRQKVAGLELVAGYDGASRVKPYVGAGLNYMDLDFHVNAVYSRGLVEDHTVQHTSGTTVSATAGVTYAMSRRLAVTAELFYSWLSVARPPATRAAGDGLLNGRVFLSYRVRGGAR
jgi:opacity protein-like surface antigen